ncbi:protocatechuate 3,4-dioxygenase alpha subunit [Pseudomonas duriflava]|uniref:Protocatechuate 3,4-dioxygenase alpha subunit n=2 Tax=Pseudomonas duriflava TaxID=459528 RepID=A0A562PJS0_9PSED|nr:protocatechuate 3,4-dioxygenase alpha subunit [Pseudomonas duriflava]
MLLWLISAAGFPNSELEKAREEAQEKKAFASKCAAIRRVVSWERMATALTAGPNHDT